MAAQKSKNIRMHESSYNAMMAARDALERLTGRRPTMSEACGIFAHWAKEEADGRAEALKHGHEDGFRYGWATGLAVLSHAMGELLRLVGVFHDGPAGFYYSPKAKRVLISCKCPECDGMATGGKYEIELETLATHPSVITMAASLGNGTLKPYEGTWPPSEEFMSDHGEMVSPDLPDMLARAQRASPRGMSEA